MSEHITIHLILPWPPSMNGYWRSILRGRRCCQILSAKAREYRVAASEAMLPHLRVQMIEGPVKVTERFYPPDKRVRDMSNYRKAYEDAITHFGLWKDDSQVVEVHGYMMPCDRERPRVEVTIERLDWPAQHARNEGGGSDE
jgi:crossover junction endodeoxyribonuclease RusA